MRKRERKNERNENEKKERKNERNENKKKSEKEREEEQKERTELPVKLKENWILQHTFHREWIKHSIVEKNVLVHPRRMEFHLKMFQPIFFFFLFIRRDYYFLTIPDSPLKYRI